MLSAAFRVPSIEFFHDTTAEGLLRTVEAPFRRNSGRLMVYLR